MPFKTPGGRPSPDKPKVNRSAPKKPLVFAGGLSVAAGSTRPPHAPVRSFLAPGGEPVRIASTETTAHTLTQEAAMSVQNQVVFQAALAQEQLLASTFAMVAGSDIETFLMTQESHLSVQFIPQYKLTEELAVQRLLSAQMTRGLTQEAVVSATWTTVSAGIVASVLIDGITTAISSGHVTTASVAPTAGALLVLAFETPNGTAESVIGLGATWVRTTRASTGGDGNGAVEVWRTQTTAYTSGTVSFQLSQTNTPMRYSLMSFVGASTLSTEGAAAIVQTAQKVSISTAPTLGSTVSMAPAAVAMNLMLGIASVKGSTASVTTGSGFTMLSNLPQTGSVPGLYTEWGASTSTSITMTWTTLSSYKAIGIEIG